LEHLSQHEKIDMFIISSNLDFILPPFLDDKLQKPHRMTFYLFDYRLEGTVTHNVDFKDVTVNAGQMLFLQPHQVHSFPPKNPGGTWFKLAISEDTLIQLRTTFIFLLNPFNISLIHIDPTHEQRIIGCFRALEEIIHHSEDKSQALVHSYLNTLLTELDLLYFKNQSVNIPPTDLSVFTRFKILINETFKSQPTIPSIASELNISETKLYSIVKSITGNSPKEYLINRIIVEAKRCLFYREFPPKELSYYLGFKEPNYFFRIFKKYNRKSITHFMMDLEEMPFAIQK
jgi:AraC family transcriptional regulator, transcriptional activator of pobA